MHQTLTMVRPKLQPKLHVYMVWYTEVRRVSSQMCHNLWPYKLISRRACVLRKQGWITVTYWQSIPADTWRNFNVIIPSKHIAISFWRNDEVIFVSCVSWDCMPFKYIDGLVQNCRISSALAMEIMQSCTKPSVRNLVCIYVCIYWQMSLLINWCLCMMYISCKLDTMSSQETCHNSCSCKMGSHGSYVLRT